MTTLHFLCAGAAQGLLLALQPDFEAQHGLSLRGRFGAVGVLKEALLAGEPCDLMVSTDVMVDALVADGRLRADARAALGRVRTGVAVRSGQAPIDVSTPLALKAALLAADEIHFPDPLRATAGIHFANVLKQLDVFDALQPRFRTHANGATAMRAMAAHAGPRLIGCTQISEILFIDGVVVAGALPLQFELATVYTAAVNTNAAQTDLAAQLVAAMGSLQSQALRGTCGFEF